MCPQVFAISLSNPANEIGHENMWQDCKTFCWHSVIFDQLYKEQ